jgi:hypothetical protein
MKIDIPQRKIPFFAGAEYIRRCKLTQEVAIPTYPHADANADDPPQRLTLPFTDPNCESPP